MKQQKVERTKTIAKQKNKEEMDRVKANEISE